MYHNTFSIAEDIIAVAYSFPSVTFCDVWIFLLNEYTWKTFWNFNLSFKYKYLPVRQIDWRTCSLQPHCPDVHHVIWRHRIFTRFLRLFCLGYTIVPSGSVRLINHVPHITFFFRFLRLGPLLLTWINFDISSNVLGWNYSSIPKIKRLYRVSLGLDKYFHRHTLLGMRLFIHAGVKVNPC